MTKLSRYNHFHRWRDGFHVAYNAGSGAVALMTDENYATYRQVAEKMNGGTKVTWSEEEKTLLGQLKYGRFAYDDDYDELQKLKFAHNVSRYNQSHMGMIIAPTMACNMACQYCYEGNKTGRMSSDVIRDIIAAVQKQAPGISKFQTNWYGGEPLLAFDIIEELTSAFLELGEKHEFGYVSTMISNGYLLTKEVADRLPDLRIRNVQITLDGPSRLHNQKRPLKNGRDSFRTIVENIHYASSKVGIGVRVNIDRTYDAAIVEELLGELEEADLRQRIGLYFGQVEPATKVCANISETCYEGGDFSQVEVEYYRLLLKHGFYISKLPTPLATFCFCQSLNSFVVDPSGNLYRCLHYVGDESMSMGNVGSDPNYMHPNFTRLFDFDPFSEQSCTECNLLPVCLGGCPSRRMDRGITGVDQCESWKHNLCSMLEIIAASRQQQAQAQARSETGSPAKE